MPLDVALARRCLKDSDFNCLFIEGLGWDRYSSHLDVTVDDRTHSLSAVAQKRGMVAFVWQPPSGNRIPDYPTRRKVERKVAKSVHEHLIVYVDGARTMQVWQWVKREAGKPTACREHTYHHTQPGDALIQKLQALAFSIEDEEGLTLFDVTSGVRAGFDVEKVTKRFYDRFKTEHAAFTKFLKGIPDEGLQRWYVSVMLNRLMFIYFIQKKGFLDNDADYLRNKLAASRDRGKDRYYRDFLCPLFFEGFAKQPQDRSAATNRLLGQVPYLNGGLFLKHQIEEQHGRTIEIPDKAFEKIFAFFDTYQWHLDERPLKKDNEINPDVLGYIFEKYINAIQPGEQKAKGAYYTKEDITGYISQNTVIPRLFDMARTKCKVAFDLPAEASAKAGGGAPVWRLLAADPDRYIYEPVRRGVIAEDGSIIPEPVLPDFVQKGMHDPKARMFDKRYNLGKAEVIPGPDGPNLALPTETWREYVERRKRCLDLRRKIAAGEVHEINDLITLNLDIRQFAQDVVENAEGPDLLVAFWNAIQGITVLDPACGSGAFLFAALNILEPLYEACLDRMTAFLDEWGEAGRKRHPNYHKLFTETLARVAEHPSRRYFILKSIVIQNLYGVDIMDEAVEICKLRLFLKLVAQVDDPDRIEPLPDIDFNIRAGNTLVGFATRESVREALAKETSGQQKMVYGDEAEALK
ncbi:MAG TPA: DNA methyltransferase, partial [Phycisphaerae bacterium]|nr:DNA methyltransferase [Phycisphaerae bacterium]